MELRVELSPLKLFHILTCTEHSHCAESIAGVKQEQWERWRAKRKLVSGFKHRGLFCGGFSEKILRLHNAYAKSCNLVHRWPENV